jgi:TonB family protein
MTGRARELGKYVCLLCASAGACAAETSSDSPQDQVRRSAAATLPCDEASIHVLELDGGEYTAVGCGRLMRFDCATRAVCCPFVEPGMNLEPAPPASDQMTMTGSGRSRESIRAVLLAQIERVRTCYQEHLYSMAWPSEAWPHGKIVVAFTIAADGSVTEADLARTSYGDAGVEACVLDVIRSVTFEPIADSVVVRVTYPFVFQTEGEPPTSCRGVPAVVPVPPTAGVPM